MARLSPAAVASHVPTSAAKSCVVTPLPRLTSLHCTGAAAPSSVQAAYTTLRMSACRWQFSFLSTARRYSDLVVGSSTHSTRPKKVVVGVVVRVVVAVDVVDAVVVADVVGVVK